MKFKILPMLLALSVLPASTVWADDEIETGQVVISASRIEQLIEDVPANISVVTAEEIQKTGMTDVTSLLNAQAGLSVSNSAISIRGMGDYTLILINGRKPAEVAETTKDGLDHFLNTLNIYDIERIEIIKGAASTMYGSDAMGGVINIITKKSATPTGYLATSISNSNYSGSLNLDSGIHGKYSAKVSSSITRGLGNSYNAMTFDAATGEYERADIKTERDVDTSVTGGVSLGYYHNDNHSAILDYTYSRDFEENSSTDIIFQNAGLDYQGLIGGHSYSIVPSFSSSQHVASKGEEISNPYSFLDLGVDAMDTFAYNDWNLLTVGASYLYSDITSETIESVTSQTDALTEDGMHTIGAFVQDEILLFNEKIILLPSVRFDYSNFSTPQFTARLGATYEFMPNQRLKLNFGQAYKTPTLTQLAGLEIQSHKPGSTYHVDQDYIDSFFSGKTLDGETIKLTTSNATTSTAVDALGNAAKDSLTVTKRMTLGNSDLEPEVAYTLDGRYEGSFGPLNASLGGYFTVKENAFSNNYTVNNNEYDGIVMYNGYYYVVTYRTNIENTLYYRGIEADLSYKMNEYFNTNLSYALMNNVDEDGYRLTGHATHNFTYTLGFTYPDWDVFANVWGKYNIDYQVTTDTATTDNSYKNYNYFNVDLAIGKVFKDKYTLVASANNILQSNYTTEYSGDYAGTWVANPDWSYPSYKLTFTAKF